MSVGLGLDLKTIKSMKDLDEAIENTEKRIEEIKLEQGNDIENYLYYKLHLIDLKKLKKYNLHLEKMGMLYCLNCEGENIQTTKYRDYKLLATVFVTVCEDCGFIKRYTMTDEWKRDHLGMRGLFW